MTMESELKRIADALEAVAARAPVVVAEPPKAMTDEKPAEEPKRRGRPPKADKSNPSFEDLANQQAVEPAKEPATEPDIVAEMSADDGLSFLDEQDITPIKQPTREDVRAALIAYQKRCGDRNKAQTLLVQVGGCDVLAALKPEKFQAVIDTAAKAK